ncbi:hypothetical protein [Nonomuraea sp. NPDC049129]|uniref:hypothetical protein n=1 Tax=Nonomuraea sp. NPDC049129 TaxID=3155272 RepID=UPI0033CADA94
MSFGAPRNLVYVVERVSRARCAADTGSGAICWIGAAWGAAAGGGAVVPQAAARVMAANAVLHAIGRALLFLSSSMRSRKAASTISGVSKGSLRRSLERLGPRIGISRFIG